MCRQKFEGFSIVDDGLPITSSSQITMSSTSTNDEERMPPPPAPKKTRIRETPTTVILLDEDERPPPRYTTEPLESWRSTRGWKRPPGQRSKPEDPVWMRF